MNESPIAPEPSADEAAVQISRIILAPRQKVFAAFSSIEELKKWFGPGQCHVTGGTINFRTGGMYVIGMNVVDAGDVNLVGEYLEIIPGERIAFSWEWTNNPALEGQGITRVSIDFFDDADSGGTTIQLRHEGFLAAESTAGHDDGWRGSFDKLDRCFF
ncbi:MAG: SRPBCC domain-containing protein [Verrucomicrobiales bacterium]|nr:SRPBCC domain-containing protein [Verrucomicrobiales bacterium]